MKKKLYHENKINWYLYIGGAITAVMVGMILLGAVWTPYDPGAMDAACKADVPSFAHIMGTDNFGRDIFSRVLQGAGTTLFISSCVVLIGTVFGVIIGGLTGYFGGWGDELLMRICDAITAFPSILLALVVIAVVGPGKWNVIWVLGILFIPSFARIVRSEFAKCKHLNYVKSARLMGAGPVRIMVRHILPNTFPVLLPAISIGFNNAVLAEASLNYVKSARLMGAGPVRIMVRHILPNTFPVLLPAISIGFNNAVLAEASMSFLGIGVSATEASLGRMLSDGQSYLMRGLPWYPLFVGLVIVLLILGFSMLGEGLQQRRRSLGRMLSDGQSYLMRGLPWYPLFVGLVIVLLILGFSMLGEGLQQRRRR